MSVLADMGKTLATAAAQKSKNSKQVASVLASYAGEGGEGGEGGAEHGWSGLDEPVRKRVQKVLDDLHVSRPLPRCSRLEPRLCAIAPSLPPLLLPPHHRPFSPHPCSHPTNRPLSPRPCSHPPIAPSPPAPAPTPLLSVQMSLEAQVEYSLKYIGPGRDDLLRTALPLWEEAAEAHRQHR